MESQVNETLVQSNLNIVTIPCNTFTIQKERSVLQFVNTISVIGFERIVKNLIDQKRMRIPEDLRWFITLHKTLSSKAFSVVTHYKLTHLVSE